MEKERKIEESIKNETVRDSKRGEKGRGRTERNGDGEIDGERNKREK